MVDLIPGINFTDGDRQVYGSIFGAVLGGLVGATAGALSTYFIGNHERNKQDESHKIELNRSSLRKSARDIGAIEFSIDELLIKCEANNEYARDIQRGLIKQDANKMLALMQLSTPFEYPKLDTKYMQTVLNDRIVTLWGNLCQEVELQNKNIADFANYYKMLMNTVHSSLIKKEALDVSIIKSDSATIVAGMEQQLKVNAQLRDKCLNLLALTACFKKYLAKHDLRDLKSLGEYRQHIEKMASYQPEGVALAKEKIDQNNIFNPKIMFKSQSTGDSV